jgi:hypothetical protein
MTTTSPTTKGRPAIGEVERAAWAAVVALTSALGVGGFIISFERVNDAMRPYFGGLAWMVPIGVDLGIFVFTALDLLMAYRDLRSVWLRYVPRALVAVTIYLNVVGVEDLQGKVAHAVLPGLWVIAVEVAGLAARMVFGLATGRARLERIRRSRWLLAPIATARLRRRMVLREETSFTAARDRDLAFELAKADMRDRYGPVSWRWKAPRRERLLLRRGEVAPVPAGQLPTVPVAALAPVSGPDGTGPEANGTSDGHRGPGRRRPSPARRRSAAKRAPAGGPAPEVPPKLLADAQTVIRQRFGGVVPGRDRLVPPLRNEHGHSVPSDVGAELMRQLGGAGQPLVADGSPDNGGLSPDSPPPGPTDSAPVRAAVGADRPAR